MSANVRWKGMSPPTIVGIRKTRVFLLPYGEDRIILSSFVWIRYQRVMDRRTGGRTDGIAVAITALCIASNAARCKICQMLLNHTPSYGCKCSGPKNIRVTTQDCYDNDVVAGSRIHQTSRIYTPFLFKYFVNYVVIK